MLSNTALLPMSFPKRVINFLLDGKIYVQINGVSMGSPLGPVLPGKYCYKCILLIFLIFGSRKAQSDVFSSS